MKIAFFGNCQLRTMADIFAVLRDDIETSYFSNNSRTGNFLDQDIIHDALHRCDAIVYQHLDDRHGILSSSAMRRNLSDKILVSVPYVFNSGLTVIGYAPMSPKNSFGEIFGAEEIYEILDHRESHDEVIGQIELGNDLGSVARFSKCMSELKEREKNLDVKLHDFICEHYRDRLLMITHNHPTNKIMCHMIGAVSKIISTEIDDDKLDVFRNQDNGMIYTGAPYVPQDARRLGLGFGWHSDWKVKVAHLVSILIRHRQGHEDPARIYEGVRLPDMPSL